MPLGCNDASVRGLGLSRLDHLSIDEAYLATTKVSEETVPTTQFIRQSLAAELLNSDNDVSRQVSPTAMLGQELLGQTVLQEDELAIFALVEDEPITGHRRALCVAMLIVGSRSGGLAKLRTQSYK